MANEQARQFLDQATQSIQGGQFDQALELVEQGLSLDPTDGDLLLAKGVVLARTGRPDDATAAFRQAIQASPQNAKAYYNLAVHQYSLGQKTEALAMAEEASKLDPSNASARELATRITSETSQSLESAPPPATYGPMPPNLGGPQTGYRPGYQEVPAHSLQFVERLGKRWDQIAYGIIAVSIVVFLGSLGAIIPMFNEMMKNPRAFSGGNTMMFGGSPLQTVLSILGYLFALLSLIWIGMDIADRRGNWLWILVGIICCCCGLHWIGIFIYLLGGRK